MDIEHAARQCIKAAILTVTVFVCCVFLFDWNKWWLTASVLSVYPLALFYGFLYGLIFGTPKDFQALSDEELAELAELDELEPMEDSSPAPEPQFFFEEVDDSTELSPTVIGRFKDADIHEYVVVNHPSKPGEKLTCTFSHVVHDTNMFTVPVGCWFVLLMPGIVYTAPVEPENSDD